MTMVRPLVVPLVQSLVGDEGAAIGYQWLNNEAKVWYNAALLAGATDNATTIEKSAVDTFVGALKVCGAWPRLSRIAYFCAWDPIAAKVDLKTATTIIAVTGSTFFRSRGFKTNGSVSDWINLNFIASADALYLQNDACLGLDVREDYLFSTAYLAVASATTTNNLIGPRDAANKIVTRVNSAATNTSTATVADASGLIVGNRTGAANEDIYKNGVLFYAGTTASAARQSLALSLGRSNATYTDRQALLWFAGGSMDATMQAAVNAAWVAAKATLGITTVYRVNTSVAFTAADTIPQISQVVLPDGAYAVTPNKGYPCTGLAVDPDGTLWGGRGLGTMTAMAGLSHLSAPASMDNATATLLAEWTTAAIFAAVGGYTPGITGAVGTYPAMSSTQGVVIPLGAVSGNHDVTWVAVDNVNGFNYYCVAHWDGAALTGISCSALPNANINAVIPSDNAGLGWMLNSLNSGLYRCTIAGGIVTMVGTQPLITVSQGGGAVDQMTYIPEIDVILVTGEASGQGAVTAIHPVGDYGRPYVRVGDVHVLASARQIEGGIYIHSAKRTFTTNDQYTHLESPPNDINCLQAHGPITLLAA